MKQNLRDHRASSFCWITATSWIRLAALNNPVDLTTLEGDKREGNSGDAIGEERQDEGHAQKVMPELMGIG